jgi:hypothetical protein
MDVPISGTVTVGNTVTVGSLPAISGTVTANSTAQKYFSISAVTANRSIIGYSSSGGNQFTEWNGAVDAQVVISGSYWANGNPAPVSVANSVTIASLPAITGTVTVGNTVTIAGTVTANASNFGFEPFEDLSTSGKKGIVVGYEDDSSGEYRRVRDGQPLPVTINPSGAIPAISGTVTANGGDGTFLVGGLRSGGKTALQLDAGTGYLQTKVESLPSLVAGTNRIGVVTIGAGTVTLGASTSQIGSVTASNLISALDEYEANAQNKSFLVTASIMGQGYVSDSAKSHITNSLTISSLPAISGTVTANLPIAEAWAGIYDSGNDCIKIELANLNGDTLSPSNPLPISGTVTANSSNGSLTTRFGSVTTANTAFATSAVTNTNRKYLLIQNITTASNVITVGIGFTPTTTQGIQLFAGAGLTFEGSYIPTGAVNLLSSVTASCYTILEA